MYFYTLTVPRGAPAMSPVLPPPIAPVAAPAAQPKHKYLSAIWTLLCGIGIVWVRLMATIAVIGATIAFFATYSTKAHAKVEKKIDKEMARVEHTVDAATGQPCESQRAFTAYRDSVAASSKALATTATPSLPPKVPARPFREARRSISKKKARRDENLTSLLVPAPPTPGEVRLRSGQVEGFAWSQHIRFVQEKEHKNLLSRLGIGKVLTIKGHITNTASVATYKEVVMRIRFLSKDGIELDNTSKVLRILLPPGSSQPINETFMYPAHTKDAQADIVGADYLLPHL